MTLVYLLYHASLRDLLMQFAATNLIIAKWTNDKSTDENTLDCLVDQISNYYLSIFVNSFL